MGFNMTKKVALKAAVFGQFAGSGNTTIPHFEPKAFWRHSIYTGVLSRILAQASGRYSEMHPEDVYISGLLHDIGTIILLQNCPDRLGDVFSKAVTEQRRVIDVEQELLGYTHADVGSVLAIKWFLPEELTIAVRYHETPESDPFHQTLSTVIALADRLASANGKPAVPNIPVAEPDPDLFRKAGLQRESIDELLEKADADFAASEMPF
jgi:HD-like signal output (HDOD) protein